MPSLRDLEVVHRLNAPTRSAATRRRRLRKACACLCVVGAALVATGGGSGPGPGAPSNASSATAPDARSELTGRQLVPVRADASLVERVSPSSRVDVWALDGTRLASSAPVVPSTTPSSQPVDAVARGGDHQLLVALTPADITRITRHHNDGEQTWPNLFLTMHP